MPTSRFALPRHVACRCAIALSCAAASSSFVVPPAYANGLLPAVVIRTLPPRTITPSHDIVHAVTPLETEAPSLDLPHVTFGRAVDLVGRPIDYSRPVRVTGSGAPKTIPFTAGQMPSRMPVAARSMTSSFGLRHHPILGTLRAHSGIDLSAPMGSPVFATSDGIVNAANWNGGYGLFVALDHGRGMQTRYGHMSRLNVTSGQQVRKGDVLGFVGSTGMSTGAHLHYEVRMNGQAVNPVPFLKSR